jgi:hypothetical protein
MLSSIELSPHDPHPIDIESDIPLVKDPPVARVCAWFCVAFRWSCPAYVPVLSYDFLICGGGWIVTGLVFEDRLRVRSTTTFAKGLNGYRAA